MSIDALLFLEMEGRLTFGFLRARVRLGPGLEVRLGLTCS